MLEPQEPTAFDLIPTADLSEWAGRLWVRQDRFHESTAITAGVTMQAFLADLGIDKADGLSRGYGSYLLTREPPVQREGGYMGFTFAKPKTAAELLVPFNEETIWVQNFRWPAVLQVLIGMAGYINNIETEVGSDSTGATANAKARLEAQERLFLVPEQRLATEVIVREYQSPSAFDSSVFFCDPPVDMEVSFSYLGMRRSIVCLHDKVTIPEQMVDATQIEGFGTDSQKGVDFSRGQIFEKTNHTTRRAHIFDIESGKRGGVYYMKTYEALPPKMPKPLPL